MEELKMHLQKIINEMEDLKKLGMTDEQIIMFAKSFMYSLAKYEPKKEKLN